MKKILCYRYLAVFMRRNFIQIYYISEVEKMKSILLNHETNDFRYYKANLHCHSTVSDGSKTPEQIKEDYKKHGYSIVAYTDHDAFILHNELTDDSFLALNGYEMEITEPKLLKFDMLRTCHMCFIAKEPDHDITACYHRTKYFFSNAVQYRDSVHYDENLKDYERSYHPDCISEMMRIGREKGFFVTYNHPYWSLEHYPEYSRYENMNAMEIVNYGCAVGGYDDDNGHCYEDLIRGGRQIYCIATDDNHNQHSDEDPKCDSYGGFVMIGANQLKYHSIIEALEKGSFFSSTGDYKNVGPMFRYLEYEDGKVRVETSDVKEIALLTNSRACRSVHAAEGDSITEAEFPIKQDEKWFRLVIRDKRGYKAYTNAYFTEKM
jgi:Predicted metal-dependent phosphoesterases (PHP family)